MKTPLSFGLQLPSHLSWPETVENCRRLEALGFDSLWLNDLVVSPMGAAQPWFSAWPSLAALAVETTRIRLGTLISTFLLRHPALLAKDVVTVDHISGGRLEVGIGSGGGEAARDARALGLPFPDARGRARRFQDGVALLDSLLRGNVVQATGEHFQAHGVVVSPPPLQAHIPLTIAANGEAALKVAARFATKWNSFMGEAPRAQSRDVIATIHQRGEKLDEFALQGGRDPGEIARSFLHGWTPDTPWASPSAFEDFVGRYQEAGISEFIFPYPPELFATFAGFPTGSVQPGVFDKVAHELIPTVRGQ